MNRPAVGHWFHSGPRSPHRVVFPSVFFVVRQVRLARGQPRAVQARGCARSQGCVSDSKVTSFCKNIL